MELTAFRTQAPETKYQNPEKNKNKISNFKLRASTIQLTIIDELKNLSVYNREGRKESAKEVKISAISASPCVLCGYIQILLLQIVYNSYYLIYYPVERSF